MVFTAGAYSKQGVKSKKIKRGDSKSQNSIDFLLFEPCAVHFLCVFNKVTMMEEKISKFSCMSLFFFADVGIRDLRNSQYDVEVCKRDCIHICRMSMNDVSTLDDILDISYSTLTRFRKSVR